MIEPSQVNTHRYVLRATIEFTTPFLVGSGGGDALADVAFVADANGLPAIPGSSIAGILRSLRSSFPNDAAKDKIFGYQGGARTPGNYEKGTGEGSRLSVSWACIHDCHNTPVQGIMPSLVLSDPVLASAFNPNIRDHVRINHYGASDADDHGKFDERAVCAGHRFTFELELIGSEASQGDWTMLLEALYSPSLRIGSRTRRGFGSFKLLSVAQRAFDLRSEFDDYKHHPVSMAVTSMQLREHSSQTASPAKKPTVILKIAPMGHWMFGGGNDIEGDEGDSKSSPVRDCRIRWHQDEGGQTIGIVEDDVLVIPASGLKGAIAHRVAFHYNMLCAKFAEETADISSITGENNYAVRQLFGCCRQTADAVTKGDEQAQSGRVIIDDLYLSRKHVNQLIPHVGIDRFTAAARDQVLFSERPLWQGETITIPIQILEYCTLDEIVKKAFELTVEDVCSGNLQIGAGHGRGLGYFQGTMEWTPSSMLENCR